MAIRRYEYDSTTVEADQLTEITVDELAEWCGGLKVEEIDPFDDTKRYPALNVPTRYGIKRASLRDYIIKYPAGHFLAVPENAFAAYSKEL